MNYKKILLHAAVFVIVTILQTFMPSIIILHNAIRVDLYLIYLTVIALLYTQLAAILSGFIFGVVQDFTTQYYMLGTFAFMKSVAGYVMGSINNFRKIWSRQVRYLFLFGCYNLHFMIYHYVHLAGKQGTFFIAVQLMLVQSFVNILLLWFVDRYLFNSKLV